MNRKKRSLSQGKTLREVFESETMSQYRINVVRSRRETCTVVVEADSSLEAETKAKEKAASEPPLAWADCGVSRVWTEGTYRLTSHIDL